MSKFSRSARGELVNFDLLMIKQQLASAPIAVGVDERRRFIDEKDGIRVKQIQESDISAFALTQAGIEESEAAIEDSGEESE